MNGHNSLQTILEGIPRLGNPGALMQPNRLIINVGGTRFETYKSTLRNIPDTRLAWITESKADNPDYDPTSGEYFFDRHPSMFLMILNYYRTGKLHTPSDVCGPAFEEELTFWGIDEKQIESCCWGSYSQHRDAQHTLEELRIDPNFEEADDDPDDGFGSTAEKFGITESEERSRSTWEKLKPRIWSTMNNQSASRTAKAFTVVSLSMTALVITTFILETHPCCRVPINETDNVTMQSAPLIEYRERTKPHPALFYIEIVCMIELTIETLVRFIVCPARKLFLKTGLNAVDCISLLSFYIMMVICLVDIACWDHKIAIPLQFLRLVRVFRIFKVATHLPALKILFHTLKASAMELLLMVMLIFSLIVCFASVIYFAEQLSEDPSNSFVSIPMGFWWAIVTMTTLGYGDIVPKTAAGYLVGCACAIFGVLFIALPIPIIVNNFSTYYTHAKAQEKLPKKRKVALVGAADALKQRVEELSPLEPQSEDSKSETSSIEPTLDRGDKQLMISNGSKETIKYSDDSGIVNGSMYSAERTPGGISVTFTDVEETEEAGKVRHLQNGTVLFNAHSSFKPDFHTIRDDAGNHSSISPSERRRKNTGPTQARSRRASLLPGGVSNPPPIAPSTSPKPPMKTARERRQSLMPATFAAR